MNLKQFLSGAEKSFPFRIISGEGLDREIAGPCAQVDDGTENFWSRIKGGQMVVINPENLRTPPLEINAGISCLFLSCCDACPAGLIEIAAGKKIPLVISSLEQEFLASRLTGLLREKLESTVYLHGSMVVYKDIGVLVTGKSGSGKSRCCLELMARGAKLVADDLVEIRKERGALYGKSPARTANLIEIRGVGLRDVRLLFDENASARESRIDTAFEISETARAGEDASAAAGLGIMGVTIPLEIINADGDRPAYQAVKRHCEERCRDNYR